jgi:hypothetical protein
MNGAPYRCTRTNKTMSDYGLADGLVSPGSQPDAYILDAYQRVRGIIEVKSSVSAPIESLRQAAAHATNIVAGLSSQE